MAEKTTYRMEISAEHMRNIFGEGDHFIQKIEQELHVVIVNRDGYLNITGSEQDAKRAEACFPNCPSFPEKEEQSKSKK